MPIQLPQLSPGRFLPNDPRYYQIGVLASLLVYGFGWLAFDIDARQSVILLGTALITQFLCTRLFSSAAFDPRERVDLRSFSLLVAAHERRASDDHHSGDYDCQ